MVRGFALGGQTARAGFGPGRIAGVTLLLGCFWLAHIGQESRVSRAAASVVLTGFGQTELTVYRTTNLERVGIILSVVLPPADRAQPHGGRHFKSKAPTAWAAETGCNVHLVQMDG